MHFKHGRYWYVFRNQWTPLEKEYADALRQYSGLIAPKAGTLPDLIDRWLGEFVGAKKTIATYSVCCRMLKKAFAEFSPQDLRAADFNEFCDVHKITSTMRSHYRSVMIGVMQLAVDTGKVERNLMRETRPIKPTKRNRYITDEEYQAIKEAAGPTMQAIMELCYLTGQRIGDVLSIRYSDLTKDGINIVQQKTGTALCVAWNPDIEAAVSAAKALHTSIKGLTLFHTRKGTPLTYWTVRTLWERATEKAKVPDAHIHDLRAKAATDAARAGIDSKGLLGHKSDAVHGRYIRDKEIPIVQGVNRK